MVRACAMSAASVAVPAFERVGPISEIFRSDCNSTATRVGVVLGGTRHPGKEGFIKNGQVMMQGVDQKKKKKKRTPGSEGDTKRVRERGLCE